MNKELSKSFENAGFEPAFSNSLLAKVAKMRAEEKSFAQNFEKNWSGAVTASECFFIIIKDASDLYSKRVQFLSESETDGKLCTYTALRTLHTRAMQQYSEIITLVRNGFSDGAFARWRSMYELSVISLFINKYGELTAEKFIEASASQDRYDWAMASNVFPETKRHVTFGDLQKHCGIDAEVWRENYTVANQTVHASPQGTFGRLGARDGVKPNAQRTQYGIAAPAIHSANTLALISSTLFSVFPDEKTLDKMALAAKWLDELTEIYCEIHDRLFPED